MAIRQGSEKGFLRGRSFKTGMLYLDIYPNFFDSSFRIDRVDCLSYPDDDFMSHHREYS